MDDRHRAPCAAFDTGVVTVAASSTAVRRRRARALHLTRQLRFERSRLEAVTALLSDPAPPNPAQVAYARRLRSRIRVLRLRIAALRVMTMAPPRP